MNDKLERIALALGYVADAKELLRRVPDHLPVIASRRDLDQARALLAEARALRVRSFEVMGDDQALISVTPCRRARSQDW